jgi:peroxiredoxin
MPGTGSKAPPFDLTALRGGRKSLADLLAGGPVVLVFFKISCPTCQFALPIADRIARAGGPLVAISQDDAEATRQFNRRFGIQMETLLDGKGYPASNAYGIEYVPTFFEIGQDGKIERSFTGFVKNELEGLGRRFGIETFREDENVPALKAG